jgi:hypothetical protein
MPWRRLAPLVLVGLLGLAVVAAAALGVAQSAPSAAVLSPAAQSKLFHTDVTRTLASKSFTIRLAGQTTVYQAPNRTKLVVDGAVGLTMSLVTVGSSSYMDFDGRWEKVPFALPGFGTSSDALSYLRALSSFKAATLAGDTFTVRGLSSDLPSALATLIFSSMTHGPNNQLPVSLITTVPEGDAELVGHVVVHEGRVTSETFTAPDVQPARGTGTRPPTGTVTYSHFNSSPPVAVPSKRELMQSTSPCGANAAGSCQVTTKGVAPKSALCRAIRPLLHDGSITHAFISFESAMKSGQWQAIRKSESDFLAAQESFAHALSQHAAPPAIQGDEHAQLTYLSEEKSDLLKSGTLSRFNALSSQTVAKSSFTFISLAQYVEQQCGGTAFYGELAAASGQAGTETK